ncbi:MAG: glycolate oxidase subunit GlcE, partial [Motiliproteus sp.]|nr:glycolate oxidase subunit GlcE [Motiliproteus sp.]
MNDISLALQEQVISARSEGRKIAIVGGGSKAFMGRQIEAEPLALAEHRGIISYHPVELVLRVRAGTPLTEIIAALDEQDQMLAFDPPQFGPTSTIGGTLACNQSGPGRPWQGSVRDHVLGIQLINGLGEHLRFGGQVMKNVAGYDVSRLMAGSMGTLGVITEISLKVLPKPAMELTLVEEMDAYRAIEVMNQRAGLPKPMTAACWSQGKLYTRLAGAASAVDATANHWSGQPLEEAEQFWQQLRDQQLFYFTGDKPLWRFSVGSAAENPDLDGSWLIDWGGSQRWLRASA